MDSKLKLEALGKRFRAEAEEDINEGIAGKIDPEREYLQCLQALQLPDRCSNERESAPSESTEIALPMRQLDFVG